MIFTDFNVAIIKMPQNDNDNGIDHPFIVLERASSLLYNLGLLLSGFRYYSGRQPLSNGLQMVSLAFSNERANSFK